MLSPVDKTSPGVLLLGNDVTSIAGPSESSAKASLCLPLNVVSSVIPAKASDWR